MNILRHKHDQQIIREAIRKTKAGQSLIDKGMQNVGTFISVRLCDQGPCQNGMTRGGK